MTYQVPVSDINCHESGVKYNILSAGVRYHVSSITYQVSVSDITCQVLHVKCRCEYIVHHILTRIARYHVLKITVASVRHVKISTFQYHVINTRVIIFKLIIA